MDRTALVTGGLGFIGRAAAQKLQADGFRVIGLGHGNRPFDDPGSAGFARWVDGDVSVSALQGLEERFDLVVHCAGNGSVGYSLTHPMEDFAKTVQTTAAVLEYMRLAKSQALLVYPSSAGVYGSKDNIAIHESDALEPISPYGHHKKIAEELLASYSQSHGLRVLVIRFFSVYGAGLTKQLLWDAGARLVAAGDSPAVFWGTG